MDAWVPSLDTVNNLQLTDLNRHQDVEPPLPLFYNKVWKDIRTGSLLLLYCLLLPQCLQFQTKLVRKYFSTNAAFIVEILGILF